MLLKIILSFFLMSSIAYGRDLTCSMSNKMLSFSDSSYSGGAAPAPGMLSHKVAWYFEEKMIYEKKSYFPCGSDMCVEQIPDIESNIEWKFLEATKITLSYEVYGHGTRDIYASQVELKSTTDENMTGTGRKSFQAWVICEDTNFFYP